MPRIHTAVVPDRTEKIAFFCRDENENPLPSPVLETGPVHVEGGDTVVLQVPVNQRGDRPLVIFISGPYSAPTLEEREANTRRAMDVFLAILAKGHYPICPHLSHYPHEYHKEQTRTEIPYEVWIELDKQYLARCDAIYQYAPSPGAEGERRLANRCGKIVFRNMDEIPDLIGGAWGRGLIRLPEPEERPGRRFTFRVDLAKDVFLCAECSLKYVRLSESEDQINSREFCPECAKKVRSVQAMKDRLSRRDIGFTPSGFVHQPGGQSTE